MPRHYEQRMGVYFDDLDAFRILHNARYLLLFERVLGSFWQHVDIRGSIPGQGDDAHTHLVASNHIDYRHPVRGIGEVRVRLWVERLGRSSLTFGFRMMPVDEDIDHAVGERVVVCVDPATYRPRPWTDAFREIVAPWVGRPTGNGSGR